MPISCHFRDCKALLVTNLTHVSGAIASVQTFIFSLYLYWRMVNYVLLLAIIVSVDFVHVTHVRYIAFEARLTYVT